MTTPVSRRDFLRWSGLSGAALVVGFDGAAHLVAFIAKAAPFEPNQWIAMDAAGIITVVVENQEMGQGVRTAIPMMVADELGARWEDVRVANGSPGPRYTMMRTSGSSSVADCWIPLRTASAAMRELLVGAAALGWGVDPAACVAQAGAVVHAASNRRVRFGELIARAATLPVPARPALRTAAQRTVIGTRVRRVDGPEIVRGQAQFGLDVRVAGMRYAAVARPGQYGASIRRVVDTAARAVPGVAEIVRIPTGIAVIADKTWSALKGRDALEIEWNEQPGATLNSAAYLKALHDALPNGKESRREGDPAAGFARAARSMEATYSAPFQPHAAMEPLSCVVHVHDGRCELWVGTQAPNEAQKEVAALLDLEPANVTIYVQLLGGSFGRRLTNDFILEAAEVGRRVRGPVQVVWSREDDFRHDKYQPAQVNRIRAALDASGFPIAWTHETADFNLTTFEEWKPDYDPSGNPWGGVDTPYAFEGLKVTFALVKAPVPTGAWRSVAYPSAVFARESFLDEIAHASRIDPVALRLRLIPSPGNIERGGVIRANGDRLREVVRLAAARAHWSSPFEKLRNGRRWGRGFACNSYHGATMVAQVAEVSVGPQNDLEVHRVVCAIDCGEAVNVAGVEGQVESGVIWGLSSLLWDGMEFSNGGAVKSNFDQFRVVRMREAPTVETHIVKSSVRALGVGEQPVPPVWPAVANAYFDATGIRARDLPLMKARSARPPG